MGHAMLGSRLLRRTTRVMRQSGLTDLVGAQRRIRAAGINIIRSSRVLTHHASSINLSIRTVQPSMPPTTEAALGLNLWTYDL